MAEETMAVGNDEKREKLAHRTVPLGTRWSELAEADEEEGEFSEQGETNPDDEDEAKCEQEQESGATAKDDEDTVLAEAMALAEEERQSWQCGDPRARTVAATALGKLVREKQMACCRGHPLVVSTTVRGFVCDGPCGRHGEEVLVLGIVEECDFGLCLSCVATYSGQQKKEKEPDDVSLRAG